MESVGPCHGAHKTAESGLALDLSIKDGRVRGCIYVNAEGSEFIVPSIHAVGEVAIRGSGKGVANDEYNMKRKMSPQPGFLSQFFHPEMCERSSSVSMRAASTPSVMQHQTARIIINIFHLFLVRSANVHGNH